MAEENQNPNLGETKNPGGKEDAGSEPSIRTFETDVAEALKRGEESLSTIALKEQQRREKKGETLPEKSSVSKKSLVVLLLVIFFISLGAGVIYFALSKGSGETPERQTIFKNPIIFSDKSSSIDATPLSKNDLINSLSTTRKNYGGIVGSIENVYITTGIETNQRLFTGPELLTALETGTNEALTRNVGDDFMYGVHAFDGNSSFLIFKIKNFEVVFARMLEWEPVLFDDLSKIFYDNPQEEFVFETEGEVAVGDSPTFEDLVIKSRDTRALSDLEGKTALIYAFPDRSTLVITTNSNTLSEIFKRLTASRF